MKTLDELKQYYDNVTKEQVIEDVYLDMIEYQKSKIRLEILVDRSIETVFDNYNDDTELLARWLYKFNYISKDEDKNYIPNNDYEPLFELKSETKEYDKLFKKMQYQISKLNQSRLTAIEYINKELEKIKAHEYSTGSRRLKKLLSILDIDKGSKDE